MKYLPKMKQAGYLNETIHFRFYGTFMKCPLKYNRLGGFMKQPVTDLLAFHEVPVM